MCVWKYVKHNSMMCMVLTKYTNYSNSISAPAINIYSLKWLSCYTIELICHLCHLCPCHPACAASSSATFPSASVSLLLSPLAFLCYMSTFLV